MWDEKFEAALRPHLPFLSPEEKLESDAPLRDLGLDSLATVELLATLESTYSVRFRDEALNMSTFDTAGTLWKTLGEMR
ncbi:phosphopantetheine-binding protein [Streptomyces sp. DSM 44915]|uniref:Phosphopantetheine-binding protein n=1 Tax=Streptomyces chisholmiae TaxID=3075540 RepID=A0ABU2JW82_9ACTN|nr:phosphopantetheine-binding protein [Streptomyces sp. DSM 44915]MDT0269262.1 phosphopantetheine-binding protein [Streptomyces sp. DSM 44915]